MPRGVYDRTKTKEQRDAEKKAPKASKTAKTAKAVAKSTKGEVSYGTVASKKNGPKNVLGEMKKSEVSVTDRLDTLLDALTTFSAVKAQKSIDIGDKLISDTMQRIELALEELQPLPVATKHPPVEDEEELEKDEAEPAAQTPAPVVQAQAPFVPPVQAPAPVAFNPPAPANGTAQQ
jgi:hypothetical protein